MHQIIPFLGSYKVTVQAHTLERNNLLLTKQIYGLPCQKRSTIIIFFPYKYLPVKYVPGTPNHHPTQPQPPHPPGVNSCIHIHREPEPVSQSPCHKESLPKRLPSGSVCRGIWKPDFVLESRSLLRRRTASGGEPLMAAVMERGGFP